MGQFIKRIVDVSYHRNGISGNGFHAVLFIGAEKDSDSLMVASVLDEPGNVSVFRVDYLSVPAVGVKFAHGNSWRGDRFEPELRAAIEAVNERRA